ncbi:nickel pincer cofactor biosynthesis protein LarC [Oleidesulfovibrio sp.]|uniref:nickel pincer cofactor biosynthesis protein LarC n=1 Tax=Oleidesulfovibrio sp. TaxID=2909707 RepID=UPI003A849DCD
MKLYIDCAFGLGGDMFLAALCGLGCDASALQQVFVSAGIDVSVRAVSEYRNGLAGSRMEIDWPQAQPLRHRPQLEDIIRRLDVSPRVKQRSMRAIARLADVEAQAHGIEVDQVHFHEVGAVDTLVDVVGAFWGLEQLGVHYVSCAPLPWFTGTVLCEHGELPLPAPATAALMQGKPVVPSKARQELITPTGALIIDAVTDEFADGPQGVLAAGATAFGSRQGGGPLRMFLLEQQTVQEHDVIYTLQTNIDHLTGEELGHAIDALMAAGALDVIFTPGMMKKNRPGGTLTLLCRPAELSALEEAVIHHTHTLGLRRQRTERVILPRRKSVLNTPSGQLDAKEYEVGGSTMSRAEYEALAALAKKTGRSLPELRLKLFGEVQED